MLTMHLLSLYSFVSPLFAKGVACKTTWPLPIPDVLSWPCMLISMLKKSIEICITFGTRLKAIKNWMVGRPEKF